MHDNGRPRSCIFFDRDGIVNATPAPARYVTRLAAFHIQPQFVESLRIANRKGYVSVVVTNQRGIALGEVSRRALDEIHDHLRTTLAREHLSLLDIFTCPHDDDAHPWRKPNPGMLLEAAKRHHIDLARSWMIGDSERDVRAGRGAGCRTIRVAPLELRTDADYHVADMDELPAFLEEHLPPA